DTVWGLGCDATDTDAVAKIYAAKHRADAKALITLMPDTAMLGHYFDKIHPAALDIARLSTTPVTVIYDNALPPLAANLIAQDGSAAVRIPRGSEFCMNLCRRLGRPLVSTSANISGAPAPATFEEISPEIIDAADYVCTTGRYDTTPHRPSSIIKIQSDGQFTIIRK
ncbi:MAG: Sua5/YciO/YrdC/YwlC family protein, partial [Muribaculaceae bacterium]|nr:Sua5/YciO/YrdC/YwlC family protein [Muribaculaceae bacterium]